MTQPESAQDQYGKGERSCPVFGIQSGGPIIGLGLLMILFGAFPLIAGTSNSTAIPVFLVFSGFGLFLIWTGFRK